MMISQAHATPCSSPRPTTTPLTKVPSTIPPDLIQRIEYAAMIKFNEQGRNTDCQGCSYNEVTQGGVCIPPNESALRRRPSYACYCISEDCKKEGSLRKSGLFGLDRQGAFTPFQDPCVGCNSTEHFIVKKTDLSSTWDKTLGRQLQEAFLPDTNGVLITTGSVRALFDALLVPESCRLIIIRDSNFHLISYMHIEILFFKIAKTVTEYNSLTEGKPCSTSAEMGTGSGKESSSSSHDITNFTKELSRRIDQSELSDAQKDFYRSHLDFLVANWFAFGKSNDNQWKQEKLVSFASCERRGDEEFDLVTTGEMITPECSRWEGVNYWEREELFNRLKAKISRSEIILSQGDITNLTDLNESLFFPLERYLTSAGSIVFEISNIWEYYKEGMRFTQLGSGNFPTQFSLICTRLDRDAKQRVKIFERAQLSDRAYVYPTTYLLKKGIAFEEVATGRGSDPFTSFDSQLSKAPKVEGQLRFYTGPGLRFF